MRKYVETKEFWSKSNFTLKGLKTEFEIWHVVQRSFLDKKMSHNIFARDTRSPSSPQTLFSFEPHNHFLCSWHNLLFLFAFASPHSYFAFPHNFYSFLLRVVEYTFSVVASHSTSDPIRFTITLAWSQQNFPYEKYFLFACHTYFSPLSFFLLLFVCCSFVRLPDDYFWLLNCGWLWVRGWNDGKMCTYSIP